jgi:hypothetical protein
LGIETKWGIDEMKALSLRERAAFHRSLRLQILDFSVYKCCAVVCLFWSRCRRADLARDRNL